MASVWTQEAGFLTGPLIKFRGLQPDRGLVGLVGRGLLGSVIRDRTLAANGGDTLGSVCGTGLIHRVSGLVGCYWKFGLT